MNPVRHIRRLAGVLAGLAAAILAFAATAPAALASGPGPLPLPPPIREKHPSLPPGHLGGPVLGSNRAGYPPISHVRTVVVGGMPGWQIALIAVGAALAAAVTAVILYRLWTARRHLAHPAT